MRIKPLTPISIEPSALPDNIHACSLPALRASPFWLTPLVGYSTPSRIKKISTYNIPSGLRLYNFTWGCRIMVIKKLWSAIQDLSSDVSYVGLSKTFSISTYLRVWGLRWYSFTGGCRILVIIKICDLQVKTFPAMYHMWVYLKFLLFLQV